MLAAPSVLRKPALCARICTLAEPCVLQNGTNGPYQGPFDASFGGIFVYDAPAGVDAVSVELCGSTGIDTFIQYWGSCTDPADPGSTNDDCCDAADPNCGTFGAGSDPSASCYNLVGARTMNHAPATTTRWRATTATCCRPTAAIARLPRSPSRSTRRLPAARATSALAATPTAPIRAAPTT